jgi:hypothetical protein
MLCLVACQGSTKPETPAAGSAAPAAEGAIAAEGAGGADAESSDPGHCEPQLFKETTPLPEASGAGWLEINGKLWLVVVADSGNDGAYALIDPEHGDTIEQGKLPLGKPGDDIEGVATHDGKLYGLTSDGWMRVWKRTGKKFELVDGPYAIGSEPDGFTCPVKAKCPINYEGLALATTPQGCAGFACSKGDGHLYCLVERDGRYAIDPERRIAVTRTNVIGDCAFDDHDVLWVGNNVFGMDEVFRVEGWGEPNTAKVVSANAFGIGNSEVIAGRGNIIYRMSDTGGAPSLMAKFRCSARTR